MKALKPFKTAFAVNFIGHFVETLFIFLETTFTSLITFDWFKFK